MMRPPGSFADDPPPHASVLSLANPIRKTKEGNPNVAESGVKREVANLKTFAANAQTGHLSVGDERQVLNVDYGLAAASARPEGIGESPHAEVVRDAPHP
jgi:hypothetical protein